MVAVILISEGYYAERTKLKTLLANNIVEIVRKTEFLTNICAEKEKKRALI